MGVLVGAAAVYLGLRYPVTAPGPAALGSSVTESLPVVPSPVTEPEPAAIEPDPLETSTRTEPPSLVDAVAETRDSVVNLETPRGLGAGVIVDPRGIVLTNYHVIDDALRPPTSSLFGGDADDAPRVPSLTARFENDRRVTAQVLVADPEEDLAVLRLVSSDSEERFEAAALGSSSGLRVGQEVFAVGNPLGLPHSVSRGIVSATHRTGILAKSQVALIQLDASINLGNSGGPLFNLDGELVGIVTARRQQAQGIAFALPMDHVKGFLRAVTDPEGVRSGMIGVNLSLREPLSESVKALGYGAGLVVGRVREEQAAAQAGLREGDTVVAIRGKRLDGLPAASDPEVLATHLQSTVRSMFPGETLKVTVIRDGQRVDLEIEIASASERDQAFIDAEDLLGLVLDPQRERPTIDGIRAGTPLHRYATILRGVTVVRFMGEPVSDVDALAPGLAELRQLVRKGGATPTVFLGIRDSRGREAEIPIFVR